MAGYLEQRSVITMACLTGRLKAQGSASEKGQRSARGLGRPRATTMDSDLACNSSGMGCMNSPSMDGMSRESMHRDRSRHSGGTSADQGR